LQDGIGAQYAKQVAACAAQRRQTHRDIIAVIFHPTSSQFVYVQATSPAAVGLLLPDGPIDQYYLYPRALDLMDDSQAYGPLTRGTVVEVHIADSPNTWALTLGIITKYNPISKTVQLLAVPVNSTRYGPVDDSNIHAFLFQEDDLVLKNDGEFQFYSADTGEFYKNFRHGLELLDVNIKRIKVPRYSPSALFYDFARRSLKVNDPALWDLVKLDYSRFDHSKIIPGQSCKLIQTKHAGLSGIYSPQQARYNRKGRAGFLYEYKGTLYKSDAPACYLKTTFDVGDEVSGLSVTGFKVFGWLLGFKTSGEALVFDANSVSCTLK
jgi:hypothetical protein